MANGTLKVSNIQTSSGSGTITLGQSGETVDLSNGTITGITQGITMCDEFRLTSDKTINNRISNISLLIIKVPPKNENGIDPIKKGISSLILWLPALI